MARGLYFLVTPVPPATLRQVNCLLLGEITLPKLLLTVQVKVYEAKTLAHGKSCQILEDISYYSYGKGHDGVKTRFNRHCCFRLLLIFVKASTHFF